MLLLFRKNKHHHPISINQKLSMLCVVLGCLIFLWLTIPYRIAADDLAMDYIDSEDALCEWMDTHPNGGHVTLTANVTITSHISVNGYLTIDTGAYGLTMDGGSAYVLSLTGEGVDTPVLTVIDPGLSFGSWDQYLTGYDVTARGRDGVGGVAVRISYDEDGAPNPLEYQGEIYSEGTGAVGIVIDNPIKAHFLSVTVVGENSTAVSAPNGAALYYCKLNATGTEAKAVGGKNILLDTSHTKGDTSDADVINRKIISLAGRWLYWPLAQGAPLRSSTLYSTFSTISSLPVLLSGNAKYPAETKNIYAQWDTSAIRKINTSNLGQTVIPGQMIEQFQGLGLEDDFSFDVTADVVENDKPCIISLIFKDASGANQRYVLMETCDTVSFLFRPAAGNFILWRSDDEGKTWYDFTDSPDISTVTEGIIFYYDDITNPIQLCIQDMDGNLSNIAGIFGYEGNTCGELGGDRTGVDRGGENPTPTPSPSATPSPSPSASVSPSPSTSPSASPSTSPSASASPSASPSPSPSNSIEPTETINPSEGPVLITPIPTASPYKPARTHSIESTTSSSTASSVLPLDEASTNPSSLTSHEEASPPSPLTSILETEQISPSPSVSDYASEFSSVPITHSELIPSVDPSAWPVPTPLAIIETTPANGETLEQDTVNVETQEMLEIQTPPTNIEISPSPIPSESTLLAPLEWEDDTTTVISGKRLLLLMNAGDTVTFVKNEFRLMIDTAVLAPLNITDNQVFIVMLENKAPQEVNVYLALEGDTLYDLPCVVIWDGHSYDISGSGLYDLSLSTTPPTPSADETDLPSPPTVSVDEVSVEEETVTTEPLQQTVVETEKKSPNGLVFLLVIPGLAGIAGGVVVIRRYVRKT